MTTLHIVFPDLRFRGLSDLLLEEYICKSCFFDALGGKHGGADLTFWLGEWQAAAALAREIERSLGIDRDGIG